MFNNKANATNFFYSFFAAIVILGALFKMTHWSIGPIGGNLMLGIGLGAEVIVFLFMAFFPERTEEAYAWENVYPELMDKNAVAAPRQTAQLVDNTDLNISLSEKLDQMLSDAKLDVNLFEKLKVGLDKFSTSVETINDTIDVSGATQKYNDQLTLASSHLESMNALYLIQLQHGREQSDFTKKYVADLQASAAHSENFNNELQGLTGNLNNLNRVYGGMLNAMKA